MRSNGPRYKKAKDPQMTKATDLDFTAELVDGFGSARNIGVSADFYGSNRWQIIAQGIGYGSKLHITAARQGFGYERAFARPGQRAIKTVFGWFAEEIYCGSKKTNGWSQSAQHGFAHLSAVIETEWVTAQDSEIRTALKQATIAAVEKYGDQVCSKCVKKAGL